MGSDRVGRTEAGRPAEPAAPGRPAGPSPLAPGWRALAPLLAALVGAVTLDGRFVALDRLPLLEHPVVQGHASLGAAFDPALAARSEQSFTPLLTLLWRALWVVGGGSPLPYRAVTLALHVAVTVLVVRAAARLGGGRLVTLGTGCVFAVHPLHATVLGGTAGHGALLGGLFGLAALARCETLRSTGDGARVVALLVAGALATPSAAVWSAAAALLLATDRAGRAPARVGTARAAAALAASIVATAGWSASLVHTDATRLLDAARGGTAALLGLALAGRGATLLVAPRDLAPFDGYGALDLHPATLVPLAAPAALSLLAFTGMLALALYRGWPRVAAAVGTVLGSLVLASGWLGPSPRVLDHGVLFPATAVASWALPAALAQLTSLRRTRVALLLCTVVLCAGLSVRTQRPYRDDETLWAHAVEVQPRVLAHQREMARVHFAARRPVEGAWHLALAAHLERHFPSPAPWAVLDALRRLPIHAKIVGLPAMVASGDTCAYIDEVSLRMAEAAPNERQFLMGLWALRYPECFAPIWP